MLNLFLILFSVKELTAKPLCLNNLQKNYDVSASKLLGFRQSQNYDFFLVVLTKHVIRQNVRMSVKCT